MGYSLIRFLRSIKETDKTIRIFDDRNFPVHTINPFSVLRLFVTNSNLNIVLSGNRTIVLDFNDKEETKEALSKLQSFIDILRQKAPIAVDKETEKYVEKIIQSSVGIGSLNGLTASKQKLEFFGDDNLDISIQSYGETHSIALNWSGILPIDRGGLNNTEFNEGEILISNSDSVISSGYKLNNNGFSEFDIWSASRILRQLSDNKVVFNIGDGQTDTFNLSHNLGTRAVIVQIFDTETGESVETGVVRTDENSVEVSFNRPPDSDKYCVIIS
jgi:uncharacterized FlaG/YvyC family protein